MQSSPADPGILASLGWVDLTALAIVLVFFVLGLFRGLVWQCSRIATLVLAYVIAGTYGDDLAGRIGPWFAAGIDPRLPLYIAYFAVFLIVLVVVSLLALLIEKLVQQAGLSFYNRVGGGVLGVATGGFVVLALLSVVLMFFSPASDLALAAERSRSMELGQRTLRLLGETVPQPVRELFGVDGGAAGGAVPGGPAGAGSGR